MAKWASGGLLVVDIFLLLFALSFAHVTAEGPAKRGLRHSIAILTEIDAYLDEHGEALRQGEETALEDFPIEVAEPEEILGAGGEQARASLLTQAAGRVYEEGMSAFQRDQETDIGSFSLQGAVRNGMDFLRPRPHRVLVALTSVLAVAAAILSVALVASSGGYGRLLALGVSVSLAALPFLILAIAVRYALRLAADGLDDYLAREFLSLGQELTWAAIRNGIIFSVGGAAFVVLGATLARWSDRHAPASHRLDLERQLR